ncbi:helix-turn-helix domain-containing protein [Chitinivorax sp. PXF-14]|uniref:helix-turn-helix domain-containing protein n=1 Tax=Chitinivorax sp. PXF-14 TaxID=3230488 RepID=UPI00346654D1
MSAHQAAKKTTTPHNWHRADVVAALKKKGWSLRRLSLQSGLAPTTLSTALERPWPKAERIIAAAIGLPPEHIWPERYAKRNFTPSLVAV